MLEKRVYLCGEEAAWLADKIVAYGDYGNDAARMLRKLSKVEQQRDELLAALKQVQIDVQESDSIMADTAILVDAAIAKAEA